MRVLYYYWGETIAKSAQAAMLGMGIDIDIVSPKRVLYDFDYEFINEIKKNLIADSEQLKYDAIFSFNYFPDLSRIADECGIKYLSWIYDSPHYTLESLTLCNSCNIVYIFDYELYCKYCELGITTVRYLPLPSRIVEYDETDREYKNEITFLGNLYDGEQDQYSQIVNLPDYIKGYIDAIIKAQQKIYGLDILDVLVDDKLYDVISQFVKTELGDNYNCCGIEIFKNILRRHITMNERIDSLKALGEFFGKDNVTLYCGKKHEELPVRNMGYADYCDEMPNIFRDSKINLNITLRSIKSGIPLRVMDILGAGGFCITNYQAEIANYFENGTEIVWYESVDDLINKCNYYLSHDEERENIARQGQMKAKELFEYSRQLGCIFKDLQEEE